MNQSFYEIFPVMTLDALQLKIIRHMREAGLESPGLDARLLIECASGWSAVDIILRGAEDVPNNIQSDIEALAARRIAGEPLDSILGYSEFYGRRFDITGNVLSPRPETEGLVDAGLAAVKSMPCPHILDLGTGSGAVVISLLAERHAAMGTAVDISAAALKVAGQNARTHNVHDRLTFLRGDWFTPVEGQFDLIVSNPPYITDAAMKKLPTEVKHYDPDVALRGGPDGLAPYRKIISHAKTYLRPGGSLIFEIGFDQGKSVSGLLKAAGFLFVTLKQDLSGHDRIVSGILPK